MNLRQGIKIFLANLLFVGGLYAQETVSASGGEASGSGGTVSYTVGQVLYNNPAGSNNNEAQGVQQPYEISTLAGLEIQTKIDLTYKVFPNPATDYLQLTIKEDWTGDLLYQLYDATGKLLKSEQLFSANSDIPMSDFPPSVYMLSLSLNGKQLQTFKIIKNK